MTFSSLFSPLSTPALQLRNRIVMAPMTRSRAVERNTPNALMAQYYGQRATAGLIITEGTSPSPNGLGYARIPGLFSAAHVQGWRQVTDAVHAQGGKVFVQLMHTGRVAHVANLPVGAEVLGPTAEVCPGEMHTDTQGLQAHSAPRAMTAEDIARAVSEYALSARRAIEAGFDGVELHAANGYLIEQFLNANVNRRNDALSQLGILYVHLLDHSPLGAPPVPAELKRGMRAAFQGLFILAGGFDRGRAEQALAAGEADLIAFARPFISNPDLPARLQADAPLNPLDMATFYTPGAQGYTDYPTLGA